MAIESMKDFSLKTFKHTVSLCHVCYLRIPASIYYSSGSVWIKKICPEHGESTFMVERDAQFYNRCMSVGADKIYNGYFIDVTKRCNLSCRYCYYPTDNRCADRPITHIISDAMVHRPMAPFILTGGEPTMRENLPDIIMALKRIGPVELLTNGTGITEDSFCSIVDPLIDNGGTHINMSIHPEILDDNLRVLDLFRSKGKMLDGILWVIDDLGQIDDVIEFCEEHRDVIPSCRIKAATRIWSDQKANEKIFVSDMIKYLEHHGAQTTWWTNNKIGFTSMELNGLYYMLVTWYDAQNIDILDKACAPYYKAQTGETMGFQTAMLINEGISKGFLNGVDYEFHKRNDRSVSTKFGV